ncbi:MAG TPA: XRE family transcriptional regulator [Bacteroidetes bacterium]|nr:XRE family transcriptional regulator [Bacteroidota bacterium]
MKQKSINERIFFGLKLKQLRRERNLNFADFSKATGISVSYLNEIEKGKKFPKEEKLGAIARALGMSIGELTSPESNKHLSPVADLLNSNFLNELPLHLFDIELNKVVEIIANAPAKVGAFISTLVEISRNYALAEENFYFGALRSYLELHNNYFEEIEKAAATFAEKNNLSKNGQIGAAQLARLLEKKYGYQIVENGLKDYPELSDIRSVFVPKTKHLLLNTELSEMQKAFQFGKELGFKYLRLKERANTAKLLRVCSFEEVLSHFKAGYFSAALLINRESFVRDMDTFFSKKKWDGEFILHLLQKYQVSQETLIQRMTNVLPRFFGLDNLFMLRFIHTPSTGIFKMDKELHLTRKHRPHGNALAEHYCGRWQSISILNNLAQMQQSGRYAGALIGVQRSHYHGSNDEYLCFTLARPAYPGPEKNVSITIGILIDDKLRRKVKFLDDPAIIVKEVNTTCERCPIENCRERSAPPAVVEARRKRKRVEEILKKWK